MSSGRARRALVVYAVLAVAIAAINVLRTGCWTQTDGWRCGPFATHAVEPPRRIDGLTRLEIAAPAWRPLAIAIEASGALRVGESGGAGSAITTGGPAEVIV